MPGEVIYTHYKNGYEKRGTFLNFVFRRDSCPYIWNHFIALEPDVLTQLQERNCVRLMFKMRDGKNFNIGLKEFQNGSMQREIGSPDKRLQYLYDINVFNKIIPKVEQLDLFIGGGK